MLKFFKRLLKKPPYDVSSHITSEIKKFEHHLEYHPRLYIRPFNNKMVVKMQQKIGKSVLGKDLTAVWLFVYNKGRLKQERKRIVWSGKSDKL